MHQFFLQKRLNHVEPDRVPKWAKSVKIVVAVGAVPGDDVEFAVFLDNPPEERHCDNCCQTSYDDELSVGVHAACKVKKKVHNKTNN